tara:strand:- start:61005 stop:63149 length:2145 start_codon:yes stop_codon:yes gene_type:complete
MANEYKYDKNGSFGTGWKNEPTLIDLKSDYESSLTNHDAQSLKISTWLDNLHVNSEQSVTDNTNPFTSSVKPVKGKSTLKPKLIRKQAEWRYTSLTEPFLNTPDIFKVDPVTFEDSDGAKQNELILNNQLNTRVNKTEFVDEYVRTCVNEGTVIVRVGWDYQTEMQDVEYPTYEMFPISQDDPQMEKLQGAMQADPSTLPEELVTLIELVKQTEIPHWITQTGVETVNEEVTTKNHPTVEVCEYDNVIIDPSCKGDMSKANFVVYSFETSKSELEKDGRYSNLDKIRVETHSVLSDPDHTSEYAESGFTFNDEPRKRIIAKEYWGYWDIDGSGITKPIVATWVGNCLIRMEENPFPDKMLPFVVVPYLPVKKSVYGEPDGELLADNQNVLGAVTRGMIDVMARSANGQIGIRKDALDVVNKRKWEKGADYEFNPGVDPRQAVINHTYPELPNSAFQMVMHQNNEAESLSGIKAFNEGISGAGLGETAAAAQGALGAAQRREMGILRRLSDGMKKIGRKIIAMNQEFLSDEEVVRVTNQEFVTVKRDDLAGYYDLRLTISTAEADEQKAKELAFMLQTTGQQFGLEMYKLILAEIAELRKMPELANQIKSYNPEPDPIAQQMQQVELEKAQLENEKTKAEIAKLYAEAGKSQADAGNKQANTDKTNLEYIEQESGVTQERELEKGKAQARGNMELEVLKNRLTPQEESTDLSNTL